MDDENTLVDQDHSRAAPPSAARHHTTGGRFRAAPRRSGTASSRQLGVGRVEEEESRYEDDPRYADCE